MKKGNIIKIAIIAVVLVLLGVGYYVSISKKGEKETEKVHLRDWNTLIEKDLDKEYPPTPTSLVEYYSELVVAYYDEDCDEELFKKLVARSRELYDKELLEKNSEEEQLLLLTEDIAQYVEEKKSIINYTVCDAEDVKYGELDGEDVANVYVTYRIREGSKPIDVEEEFFVRKDTDGNWKIVGWKEK